MNKEKACLPLTTCDVYSLSEVIDAAIADPRVATQLELDSVQSSLVVITDQLDQKLDEAILEEINDEIALKASIDELNLVKENVADNNVKLATKRDSGNVSTVAYTTKTLSQAINAGSEYNLCTALTLAGDSSFISYTSPTIKFIGNGNYIYAFRVVLNGTISGSANSAREFYIELRRASDNSLVARQSIIKVADSTFNSRAVEIISRSSGASDPFMLGGLKIVLVAPSGGANITSLSIYSIDIYRWVQ